ncbi:oligosaccharide flippase family protein [Bacillus sp. PAMC26568]|nr:oligosaccharide flippase family protein [Bacillus sp. PAMC26568]
MLKHLKRLGGDSLLYALMNVGTKLIAFLMLPIYTTYLSPSEMGAFELVEAVVSILTFVIIFGTDNALAYYFYKTEIEEEKEQFFKAALSFRLLLAGFIFFLFLVFGPPIAEHLLKNSAYYHVLLLAGVVLFVEAVITLVLTYERFLFKSKKVAGLTVLKLLLVAILSFVFLKFLNWKVESIYVGRLISGLLIILLIFKQLWSFISFRIDKALLKKLLVYGAPLVPASIAFWVITFSNRFFLTVFESLDSSGIYGVAVKFATVISLLTSSVQMAWRPYSMSIKDSPDAKKIYSNIFYLILIIGMAGVIGIATIAPYLLQLMVPDKSYSEAADFIALLSLGSFLSFYYLIISVGLFLEEKTKVISVYVGLSAILSVILNIVLIPFYSIWGAVIALLISYLFVNISIFLRSQKVYHIPVSSVKLIFIFIGGLVSTVSIIFIYDLNLGVFWILLAWAFYGLILLLTGVHKFFNTMVRGR